MKSLLVLFSYHHGNTEKIARVFAETLDAPIKKPPQVHPEELREYDLVGFGSGIYDDKHHPTLLALADELPPVASGKAFLFSTSGIPFFVAGQGSIERYAQQAHAPLREKLKAKGYSIVGEFICAGYNTNSFLKFFGGINKGRPNAEDLKRAAEFAQRLK
jgi:flavodoxin